MHLLLVLPSHLSSLLITIPKQQREKKQQKQVTKGFLNENKRM